jgi:ATP/maltotriose-dependent transcriptional regulator MalT
MRLRWFLVRVLSASGGNGEAEERMAAIIAERSHRQISWLSLADLAADRSFMWLRHDELALAEEWLYASGLQVDGKLTQEDSYSQLVHAHILIAQKNHVDAEKLFANLIAAFPVAMRGEPILKLLLTLAIPQYGHGKVNQALRILRQALRLAKGEGYVRPFLDLVSDMVTLLSLVGRQERVSQQIKRHIVLLLYEFGQSGFEILIDTGSDASALVTAATITGREREILGLVAQG